MNHALWTGVSVGVIMALSAVTANAFTLTGKVSDDSGKAVRGAEVLLVQKGLNAKTDASGAFTIHQDEEPLPLANKVSVGFLSVNNGVLSFSQGQNSPVQVQIFDMFGNRLLNEILYGSGTVDMKRSSLSPMEVLIRHSARSPEQRRFSRWAIRTICALLPTVSTPSM